MFKKFKDFLVRSIFNDQDYIVGYDGKTGDEIRITGANIKEALRGSDGANAQIQFSSNMTSWHFPAIEGDVYTRIRFGSGEWSVSRFVGGNGQDGQDGKDGTNGKDGANGTNGTNGATFTPLVTGDGIIQWSNNAGLTDPVSVNIKGTQGIQGIQGIQGLRGFQGERGERGEPGSHAQFELIDWDYYTDFRVRNYGNSVNMVYVAYDSFSGRIFFDELDEESDITVTIVNSTKNEIKIRIQKDDYAKQQIQLAPNLDPNYTTPIVLPYEKFIINGHVRNGILYLF